MKILVVEDEPKIGQYVQKGLSESGYNVRWCDNGLDGHHIAKTEPFDIIILDVMLPDIDGFRLVTALREAAIATPILFLTPRDSIDDRVKGLELGGDDYLIKPFAFPELLARVKTLLRRGTSAPLSETIDIDDMHIDLKKRRVHRGDQRIALSNKEFSLLEFLASRRGEVLTRALIASHVWDMNFDSDTNVIDVAVRRLRAKIDDSAPTKLIHTVRGMGYTLDVLDD